MGTQQESESGLDVFWPPTYDTAMSGLSPTFDQNWAAPAQAPPTNPGVPTRRARGRHAARVPLTARRVEVTPLMVRQTAIRWSSGVVIIALLAWAGQK